jgi:hypothetical protein
MIAVRWSSTSGCETALAEDRCAKKAGINVRSAWQPVPL